MTLYQITILLILVFILSGLATNFIYSHSQRRLIEKSRENLIQTEVDNTFVTSSYAIDFLIYLGEGKVGDLSARGLTESADGGDASPGNDFLSLRLTEMVDSGFMGLTEAMIALPYPDGEYPYVVVAASDGSFIYNPDTSAFVSTLVEEGDPYSWVDEPVPGLDLKSQSLVMIKTITLPDSGLAAHYVSVKPMAEDNSAINSFFDEKERAGSLDLTVFMIVSTLMVAILTLIFLSFLTRKRITEPIEELCNAADDVMAGDLDTRIPVRKGEEFEKLKISFNVMIKNLQRILRLFSQEGPPDRLEEPLDDDAGNAVLKGRASREQRKLWAPRSRTLYYITAFILFIFIAFGLVGFLIYNMNQNAIIDESIDIMIDSVSEGFSGSSIYLKQTINPVITERMKEEGYEVLSINEQYAYILREEPYDYQLYYNDFCKDLVEEDVMDLEGLLVILGGGMLPETGVVVVSSDESLTYSWQAPDYLLRAIEEGEHHLYVENGIPELGLEGEHIIALELFTTQDTYHAYLGIKSMQGEVEEMESFYREERNSIYLMLIPVLLGSFIALIILTFLVLNFLIRRNITKPVEELSEAAEEVMEGNLDVDITIREGEELEGLKLAFREMVTSFRGLISRSAGE